MFIDIHCHILPGVDDGADSAADSFEMLEQAYNSGTTAVVLTPHYLNKNRSRAGISRDDIVNAYRKIKEDTAERNIPVKLYLGCELLCSAGISEKIKDGHIISINGSRYVLSEFYFNEKPENAFAFTEELVSCGYVPVIAHPERYGFLHENPAAIGRFLDLGCLLQVNKGSPLGVYGREAEEYSKWLILNELAHCIAGDCHDTVRRNADMGDIYRWMLPIFEKDYIMYLLHDTPKRILLDKDI
ncbi:MAG: capsular biosynthesis protein [Clostridiales bacterium]|nr:capsular biosynthesis protein [Clostridiales bacterium]